MGLDAVIYVTGPVSAAEFSAAEAFLIERDYSLQRWWDDEGAEDGAAIDTSDRYYGTGYERGSWPYLYGAIQALRGAFPGREVFYGADARPGELASDELCAALWEHWRGPDGRAYFRDS